MVIMVQMTQVDDHWGNIGKEREAETCYFWGQRESSGGYRMMQKRSEMESWDL